MGKEYYHLTTTNRLDGILQNGLDPLANKNFTFANSLVPTFGGVYCTPYIEAVPDNLYYLQNTFMAQPEFAQGKERVAVIKFITELPALPDEDVLFDIRLHNEKTMKYIGPERFRNRGEAILQGVYTRFVTKQSRKNFLILKQEMLQLMTDIYESLPRFRPESVHFMTRIEPAGIQAISMIQPVYHMEEYVTFEERSIKGDDFIKEILDAAKLHPNIFTDNWPLLGQEETLRAV